MKEKIKIVFFGTPKFSEIILQKLLMQDDFEIIAVVTTPDKLVGRKQVLTPPLIKVFAEKNNIKVLQPQKLDEEFISELKSLGPAVQVVASYGKIIPQSVLDIPQKGNINVHPSLLPKYRGASPIQSVLLNGEKQTGVTIMLMDEKMDHGSTILSTQITINRDEKFTELHNKLAEIGAELLIKAIHGYLSGEIKPQEQNHDEATFCKMIKKQDGEIDWNKLAQEIYNQWRAFCEWPGVFSEKCKMKNEKLLKINFIEINAGTCLDLSKKDLGEFFAENKKLYVSCGNNTVLEVLKLQPEGKKVMDAQAFINGYLK